MNSVNEQEGKNQLEWQDANNWTSIYFSKKDSRSFVPKRNSKHGLTINFGSKVGALDLLFFFTAVPLT